MSLRENFLARTTLLLGEGNIKSLQSSNVLVIGLGGVGGAAAEMICRAGVGKMTIADGDTVSETNLNRQLCALVPNVGISKARVMEQRLLAINPELELNVVEEYLDEEKIRRLIEKGNFSCVADAIDTIAPKVECAVTCLARKIPLISSMGCGAKLDPEKIKIFDIGKTFGCPLAAAVRTRLRKRGFQKGYLAVFSPEEPVRSAVVEEFSANKRSVTGTISYMPNIFGCFLAKGVIATLTKDVDTDD